MSSLYRVIYCSRNLIPGSPETVVAAIQDIIQASRRNNDQDGITGALLFDQGIFAQALEGPADAVEQAFERVQCDSRHGNVVVLQSGFIAERDFPDWSMAFTGSATENCPFVPLGLCDALGSASDGAENVLALLKSVVTQDADWIPA